MMASTVPLAFTLYVMRASADGSTVKAHRLTAILPRRQRKSGACTSATYTQTETLALAAAPSDPSRPRFGSIHANVLVCTTARVLIVTLAHTAKRPLRVAAFPSVHVCAGQCSCCR